MGRCLAVALMVLVSCGGAAGAPTARPLVSAAPSSMVLELADLAAGFRIVRDERFVSDSDPLHAQELPEIIDGWMRSFESASPTTVLEDRVTVFRSSAAASSWIARIADSVKTARPDLPFERISTSSPIGEESIVLMERRTGRFAAFTVIVLFRVSNVGALLFIEGLGDAVGADDAVSLARAQAARISEPR